MSTSNWEDAKARSNYHFNKWHRDTDCVQHMGKFTGGWQTELQSVIDDAKPLNWANRRQGTGRENTNIDVEAEENDLKNAGADPKMDADPNNVIRIMVRLQDWEPGQFLMYGNEQFDRWRAGDIHKFDWQNIPHATANASNKPRPMLVITGVMTDTTREILSRPIKKKI